MDRCGWVSLWHSDFDGEDVGRRTRLWCFSVSGLGKVGKVATYHDVALGME